MRREDFTVGWICALETELAAAGAMLDELYDASSMTGSPQDPRDDNSYTLGRIRDHRVAIACLPSGTTGTIEAAVVASRMCYTFPSLRFGLMVGVGGGVPSMNHDIRLGDIVVSEPAATFGGVIQYDYGKTIQKGQFVRTGSLNRPPNLLLKALSTLKSKHRMEGPNFPTYLSEMVARYPKMHAAGTKPDEQFDQLFQVNYEHPKNQNACARCDQARVVNRDARSDKIPHVHYGLIASGNQVMKYGKDRDKLRRELDVLCFEMEASGLMNDYPCLVIRGICDYADSHKNKHWQDYAAAVAAAYAKELLSIIPGSQVIRTDKIGETMVNNSQSPRMKPLFTVPFRRDPYFVNREDILSDIKQHLHEGHNVSLTGMGGMGKSQLAIEYAYQFQLSQPQSHVLWINAANRSQFVQAYQDIARKLRLPGFEDSKINLCDLVRDWFDENDDSEWLVILDSADNADIFWGANGDTCAEVNPNERPLIDYIPKRLDPRRLLFITTRDSNLGKSLVVGNCCIALSHFSQEESRSLWEFHAEDALKESESVTLEKLLDVLGYIPLAITQAAAFINRNSCTLQYYLTAIERNQQNLIDHLSHELQDPRRRNYPNSVFQTWKVSFEQIQSIEPEAANLLSLIAMLDPQQIPQKLLQAASLKDVDFHWAIGTLIGYALINLTIDRESYAIHPLVQASVHYWLEQNKQTEHFADQALQLLAEEFPIDVFECREWCDLILAHAKTIIDYNHTSTSCMKYRAELLDKVGNFSLMRARYTFAHREFSEAIEINQELLGEIAVRTLRSKNLLAVVLGFQGEIQAAVRLHRQVLKGYKKKVGMNHHATLKAVDDLAWAVFHMGIYRQSESLFRQALSGRRRLLGDDHPETLNSTRKLGRVLIQQGKHQASEELIQKALERQRLVLGEHHWNTLASAFNLSQVYKQQGRHEEAEGLLKNILENEKEVFGDEHPQTLVTMSELASLRGYQGKSKEAELMHRCVIEIRSRILGHNHPETMISLHNLAITLTDQGDFEEAEVMFRHVTERRVKVLGAKHPETLLSVWQFAGVLDRQHQYHEARPLYLQALAGLKRSLGIDHPHTRKCSQGYSEMLRKMQEVDEVEGDAEVGGESSKARGFYARWRSMRYKLESMRLRV